jgi:hypothetical protein
MDAYIPGICLIYYFDKDTHDWWPDNFMEPCDYDTALRMLKYLPSGTQAAIVPL